MDDRRPPNRFSLQFQILQATIGLFWLFCLPGPAIAQQEQPSRGVVFLVSKTGDPAIAISLQDAIAAQLADVPVRLVFEVSSTGSPAMRELIDTGKATAEREDAVGVFWLDTEKEDDWLLYLVDPGEERLLVRRAGSSTESVPAAIEAVAVIVKASALALLHGQTIGLSPAERSMPDTTQWVRVEPESPAPAAIDEQQETEVKGTVSEEPYIRIDLPPPVQDLPEDERSLLRLAIAYRGAAFAREVSWQNGLGLWAGWISRIGLYGGAGYEIIASQRISHESLEFSVDRHPIELFAGYRYRVGRFAVDGELAAILDIVIRRAQSPESGFRASDDRTRLVFGLLTRARAEYAPVQNVAFFAGAGISFFFNNFEYVGDFEQREVLLSPRKVCPDIEVGAAIRL
jgi:hypothetical protein